jgi:hypothetical protein
MSRKFFEIVSLKYSGDPKVSWLFEKQFFIKSYGHFCGTLVAGLKTILIDLSVTLSIQLDLS